MNDTVLQRLLAGPMGDFLRRESAADRKAMLETYEAEQAQRARQIAEHERNLAEAAGQLDDAASELAAAQFRHDDALGRVEFARAEIAHLNRQAEQRAYEMNWRLRELDGPDLHEAEATLQRFEDTLRTSGAFLDRTKDGAAAMALIRQTRGELEKVRLSEADSALHVEAVMSEVEPRLHELLDGAKRSQVVTIGKAIRPLIHS